MSDSETKTNATKLPARWHTVEVVPSARLPEIHTWQKFNPVWWFKNVDEPVPPDWFKPGARARSFQWFLRNPFHNFTHYVIGLADKPHERSGRYPEKLSNPNGGWNFTVVRRCWVCLPCLSYRNGKFEFYFGWRMRGNFGVKINYDSSRPHPLQRASPDPAPDP